MWTVLYFKGTCPLPVLQIPFTALTLRMCSLSLLPETTRGREKGGEDR